MSLPRVILWALALVGDTGAEVASAPPLAVRASVTITDGVVWFRPGELLVGDPRLPGRPALRLLAEHEAAALPVEPGEFEDLSAGCLDVARGLRAGDAEPSLLALGDLGGDGQIERVMVLRERPASAPLLVVQRGERVVARGALPMPAEPCRGLIAEVLPDGPPYLVVVWTSRGAEHTTVGAMVLALP